MLLFLEFLAVLILLITGLLSRGGGRDGRFLEVWKCLGWISEKRTLAILLPGFLVCLGSAVVAFLTELPSPAFHDEFSYLLAGDTFAHGRLANPPHPLWRHFETFHVIYEPTYVSKYPPAQGLFLALGQVLTGYPIVGVWLSAGLACVALSWMLRAWLPPRWAFLGATLTAMRLVLHGRVDQPNASLFAYWTESYWGGAVALLGGALLFGALRQLPSRPGIRNALLLALGAAILANSRPFEGMVVSIPAAILLLAWTLGEGKPPIGIAIRRVVLPALLVLTLTAAWIGYYNFRCTGSPFRLAYLVHEKSYAAAPLFLWQPLGPEPEYGHEALRHMHVGYERAYYIAQQSLLGWSTFAVWKLRGMWYFYFGIFFTLPLATLPWILKSRWMQFAVVTGGLLIGLLLLETGGFPHYVAPAAPLGLVVVLQCMRRLHLWKWRGRHVGRFLVRPIVLVSLLTLVVSFVVETRSVHGGWHLERARIIAELERDGGQHLVLVKYGEGHSPHEEWVYNAADIDAARVIWARDMSPEDNRELLDYFKNRRVWLLTTDAKSVVIKPYRNANEGR